ncbi:MFS transporter [Lacrimispora sp.]|uniref:MFS transporter n=1 Tax=Lacrimispora sp. TaxID=2719234 RepID=UPI002FDA97C8
MTTIRKNNLISILLVTTASCLLYGIGSGIRSNYGIMLGAISASSGLAYSSVSFVLAVGQLVFGIMQPVFGIVALKKSNLFVLCWGILSMAAGLLMIPFCRSAWMLMIFLGIVLPAGTGALSFGIVMGAITPRIPASSASTVSGFVSASSGIGSIILSPVAQALIASSGLIGAMIFLSVPTLVLLPVALWLCRPRTGQESSPKDERRESMKELFFNAIHSSTYRFLLIGFFTCGFHMAIIETHLYTQITTYGVSEKTAAYAFSIYGLASIIGCVLSGAACSRLQMKQVLGFLYGLRCIIVLTFFLVPKTLLTIYAFTILLGMTGNSTVPPTSGLVSRTFGAAKLATLFGIAFLSHQIGSFFSAWLGGVSISATGSYTFIWGTSVLLSALASFVSFRIKEA